MQTNESTPDGWHVLVLQGPNMNRLGKRRPELYGRITLGDVEEALERRAGELGGRISHFQSNHEGGLIDWLYEHSEDSTAIVCNPAGLTNYGLSLRDALAETELPLAIVHMTNVHAREHWRRDDVFAEIASVYIAGAGWRGYLHALEALVGDQ